MAFAVGSQAYITPLDSRESDAETDETSGSYQSAESEESEESEQIEETEESEQSETSSQMFGRKRSASEMEDGSTTAAESSENQGTNESPKGEDTIEADLRDITVTCPVTTRQKRKMANEMDVSIFHDYPGELSGLGIDFAVKPGPKWDALLRFKNAKFNDGHVVTYTAGQFVYVNRHSPPPPPPPEDASEEEQLQYDKTNFWVGLISEFKALNQQTVYVRVFWLYWPDELPMGRQPYHGTRELVLSNHVDIIDAQSLAWYAEVSHWDERDDSNKQQLRERYWRQTLDLNKAPTHPGALSKLRKYCICGGYDNPELEMYQCLQEHCRTWNHEACLITAMEQRAWEQFKKGTLVHEIQETKGKGTSSQTTSSQKPSKTTNPVVKLKSKDKKPWAGILEGTISGAKQLGEDEHTHSATVRQLQPVPGRKRKTKTKSHFEPVVWKMEMNCLRCHHALN